METATHTIDHEPDSPGWQIYTEATGIDQIGLTVKGTPDLGGDRTETVIQILTTGFELLAIELHGERGELGATITLHGSGERAGLVAALKQLTQMVQALGLQTI